MNNSTYHTDLRKAYNQICKEQNYGYRRTYGGSVVRRDEPGEEDQLRQSDAIQRIMQKRRASASRERLKSKGAVPTKSGKKLFDEFIREAYVVNGGDKQSKIDHKRMKQVYLAAKALEYDTWILFITEMM